MKYWLPEAGLRGKREIKKRTEGSRMVFAGGWGRHHWDLLFIGHRVCLQDENSSRDGWWL